MNIVLDTVRFIANLLLPKDDVVKLPPAVIHLPKEFARIINDDDPLDESERFVSAYYLLTKNLICKQCGYAMCIPLDEIPKEICVGCNGDKSCFHDFETVIAKEKRRLKTPLGEFPAELHCEELIKTENPDEGILYFNDSWWKIKSGKSVYVAHIDKTIHTNKIDFAK